MEENAPAPKNNRNMIIAVVAALVLLCCCCSMIGVAGWLYGDTILEELDNFSRALPFIVGT